MKYRSMEGYLVFYFFFSGSVAWRINEHNSPIEALVGEDVTIPCLLSDIAVPLNLRVVEVTWTLKLKSGGQWQVYHFMSSRHTPSRPGSLMDNHDLRQGNASLYIPRVQIGDDREYTCSVRVSPDLLSSVSSVHVSVQPHISLPDLVSVEFGRERFILCEVTNFYPETMEVLWTKHSRRTGASSSLDGDTYGTPPAQNSDGTFNLTSLLTIKPSGPDEDGDRYSCIVVHRSLQQAAVRNSTLVINGSGCYTVMDVIGVLIGGLVVAGFGIAFWHYIIRGDRTLLLIPENKEEERILHKEKTTFVCLMKSSERKDKQINVYLRRCEDTEKRLIHSWTSTAPPAPATSTPRHVRHRGKPQQTDNGRVMVPQQENHSGEFLLEMRSVMTSGAGLCFCHCSLSVTPDAATDNGARLIVEAKYADQKEAASVEWTLTVISVEPVITLEEPAEEENFVRIVCRVKWAHYGKFAITWSQRQGASVDWERLAFYTVNEQKDNDPARGIHHRIEQGEERDSFSSIFTLTKHSDGWREKQFSCQIQHLETGHWEIKSTRQGTCPANTKLIAPDLQH